MATTYDPLDYYKKKKTSTAETEPAEVDTTPSTEDDWKKYYQNSYQTNVNQNNAAAAGSVANANAQYQNVLNNQNEIAKSQGVNNTGYEGDTSINAYNAYRNTANTATANAATANTSLYDNYMTALQNLDTTYYNRNQTADTTFSNNISSLTSASDTYDDDGTITDTGAERLWNYALKYYGNKESIPNTVMAELETEKGFDDWLKYYKGEVASYEGSSETSDLSDDDITNYSIDRNNTTGVSVSDINVNSADDLKQFGDYAGSDDSNSKQSDYVRKIISAAKNGEIANGTYINMNYRLNALGSAGAGVYVYLNGKFYKSTKSRYTAGANDYQ